MGMSSECPRSGLVTGRRRVMATILKFSARKGTAMRRMRERPAKVIIFPGVRYERMAAVMAAATAPKPRNAPLR